MPGAAGRAPRRNSRAGAAPGNPGGGWGQGGDRPAARSGAAQVGPKTRVGGGSAGACERPRAWSRASRRGSRLPAPCSGEGFTRLRRLPDWPLGEGGGVSQCPGPSPRPRGHGRAEPARLRRRAQGTSAWVLRHVSCRDESS